ncbi:Sec-independent protein translocase protein TatCy [Emticicia aquatica]|jgi:sec-independent protein translocase protein TatC|uniref:Sec-independent protein translocase protein TatC n=1 Tax=Emticicia aquatica TaxID=1681835 RepID=A0ABM9ATR8_9BACT|nr:twin-arginine translocase subunit TatC [Emticicia aquatica]CAH0997400.1 Sec-independent protein translocase protein TatCy [Emticicia aquatica]
MPLDQTPYFDYDDDEQEKEGKEMGFLDHLEELRWHLIRAAISIVFFMVFAFIFIGDIYNKVILAPAKPDFWTYRMMCKLGNLVGAPGLCVDKLNFELMSREVSGQFVMALTSAAIIGLVFAFPYVFWEIWRFVKPGLKPSESKSARGAVFYVTFLFFSGVFFGYYIVSPLAINFLVNFQIDPSIKNQFDIGSYISILATLTLACGVAFQLPVAIFVLTKIGVIGPAFMRTYRKHAVVVILIVAAVITPSPDVTSQLLVAFPLYILYEISIIISAREEKRKLAEEQLA